MTKEQVLLGIEFKLRSSDTTTFKIEKGPGIMGSLTKIIYTSLGDKCLEDYEANVRKIGTKTISFYKYVIGKKVEVKLRYEDLILAQPLIGNGVVEI